MALPSISVAGEKQYSVEGAVIALGTNQETASLGHDVHAVSYRTYTVKTPDRIFVLKCPNPMDAVLAKKNCYDKKPIEIGDTLHLRIEGHRSAYLQTAEGKEQRFDVLSESLNEVAVGKP